MTSRSRSSHSEPRSGALGSASSPGLERAPEATRSQLGHASYRGSARPCSDPTIHRPQPTRGLHEHTNWNSALLRRLHPCRGGSARLWGRRRPPPSDARSHGFLVHPRHPIHRRPGGRRRPVRLVHRTWQWQLFVHGPELERSTLEWRFAPQCRLPRSTPAHLLGKCRYCRGNAQRSVAREPSESEHRVDRAEQSDGARRATTRGLSGGRKQLSLYRLAKERLVF